MSDITELTPAEAAATVPVSGDGLRRLAQVRVELSVEIGRTSMSLGDALALGPGSVIGLDRMADEPVDLLVNGKLVARGEVVVIDAEYGLRVTEVVGAEPQPVEAEPFVPSTAEAEADMLVGADGAIDQAAIDAAIAAAQGGDAMAA